MPYLDVDGASLYHETYGESSKPMLLCISGADGSCEIWRLLAKHLSPYLHIILWDRRGFSRSTITGPQDYTHRLQGDANDAAALIKHFSPSTPATVIGNSSGAIVTLTLLTLHPSLLRTAFVYEPPAATLLPTDQTAHYKSEHKTIYDLYRTQGPHPALVHFSTMTHTDQTLVKHLMNFRPQLESRPFLWGNLQYWFEREFMVYPFAEFDLGVLEREKGRLVLVNGGLSPKGAYQVESNLRLGEKLGVGVEVFPGEHVGHVTHAEGFAVEVRRVLGERGYEGM